MRFSTVVLDLDGAFVDSAATVSVGAENLYAAGAGVLVDSPDELLAVA